MFTGAKEKLFVGLKFHVTFFLILCIEKTSYFSLWLPRSGFRVTVVEITRLGVGLIGELLQTHGRLEDEFALLELGHYVLKFAIIKANTSGVTVGARFKESMHSPIQFLQEASSKKIIFPKLIIVTSILGVNVLPQLCEFEEKDTVFSDYPPYHP